MSHWYMHPCTNQISKHKGEPENRDATLLKAKEILREEENTLTEENPKFTENRATNEWLKKVFKGGPVSDRINGTAVIVQETPLKCLPYLDKLIALVNPSKKRDCIQAIDVLYSLWIKYLLPCSRELITFNKRPLEYLGNHKQEKSIKTNDNKKKKSKFQKPANTKDNPDSNRLILLHWIFEEELKNRFTKFVKNLENVLMTDSVESTKRKISNIMFEFIQRKPEARRTLLKLVINKIGDPNRKLASNIVHNLNKLVQSKSRIKLEILEEVESLLFRPNIAQRAQYYSICFLNQLLLSKDDVVRPMVLKLLHIYAAFFRAAVKDKEMNERLLSALLTGVNRAVPFVKGSLSEIDEHINTLFRLVHTTGLDVALQTLMVLFHIATHRDELKERYYSALYRKLLDPCIRTTSSKEALLIHLLYKSLAADSEPDRIKAFIKRLLQICCAHSDAGFVGGVLILIAKLALPNPHLLVKENKSARSTEIPDDDDEEYFEDITNSDDETEEKEKKAPGGGIVSWDHRKLHNPHSFSNQNSATSSGYDPNARNPRFANAGNECLWELYLLKNSCHPSIALFAEKIIKGEPLEYSGDPFRDFSIAHFLDRFVFKNPKALPTTVSKTKIKSNARADVKPMGAKSLAVNSEAYLKLEEEKIPEEEKFFHRYFKFINSKGKFPISTKKKEKKDSDEETESDPESVSDSEFDEYLDKYEKQLDADKNLDDDYDDEDDDDLSDLVMSDDGEDLMDFDEESEDNEDLLSDSDKFEEKKTNRKRFHSSSEEEGSEEEDESFEDSDDDFSFKNGKGQNFNKLFVSADKTGDLFENQESFKERKQRVWEDKRFGQGLSQKNKAKKRKR